MSHFAWKQKALQAQRDTAALMEAMGMVIRVAEGQHDISEVFASEYEAEVKIRDKRYDDLLGDRNFYRRALKQHQDEDKQAIKLLEQALSPEVGRKKTAKLIQDALDILNPPAQNAEVPF